MLSQLPLPLLPAQREIAPAWFCAVTRRLVIVHACHLRVDAGRAGGAARCSWSGCGRVAGPGSGAFGWTRYNLRWIMRCRDGCRLVPPAARGASS